MRQRMSVRRALLAEHLPLSVGHVRVRRRLRQPVLRSRALRLVHGGLCRGRGLQRGQLFLILLDGPGQLLRRLRGLGHE